MDAFNDDMQCAAIDPSHITELFLSSRLVDTSADKVDPDDMEPDGDEGSYLGDLAEHPKPDPLWEVLSGALSVCARIFF